MAAYTQNDLIETKECNFSHLKFMLYLELVTFSTDAASQAWFLYELLHLLQQ